MPFSFHSTLVRDGKINTREGIVRYKFESSFLDKKWKKIPSLCLFLYLFRFKKFEFYLFTWHKCVCVLFFHYFPRLYMCFFSVLRKYLYLYDCSVFLLLQLFFLYLFVFIIYDSSNFFSLFFLFRTLNFSLRNIYYFYSVFDIAKLFFMLCVF